MILHPEDMLCFALYDATNAMQQTYRPLLASLGLTYPQYLVLRVLWAAEGPLHVGGLGDALGLESSTLTPLLKRMEAQGLVQRRRDATDERRVNIALSEAGAALESRAADIPACIARATGLDDTALAEMHRAVRALGARLRRGAG